MHAPSSRRVPVLSAQFGGFSALFLRPNGHRRVSNWQRGSLACQRGNDGGDRVGNLVRQESAVASVKLRPAFARSAVDVGGRTRRLKRRGRGHGKRSGYAG